MDMFFDIGVWLNDKQPSLRQQSIIQTEIANRSTVLRATIAQVTQYVTLVL